ncbi:MAG: DUF456 domain-containing protein [Phycisphaerales bacterium]
MLTWLAAGIVLVAAWIGVAMVAVTLPGIWMMVGVALMVEWWRPDVLNVWVIVAVVALGVIGELAEFYSSMAGSKRAGGSRAGGWGALGGTIVGLIVGQVFIPVPIIGAVIGGVAGAGIGAAMSERGVAKRTWRESVRSGSGASAGRALSIVLKTGIAAAAALTLTMNAVISLF